MHDKKKHDEDKKAGQDDLERQVDAMMDPKLPDSTAPVKISKAVAPIDDGPGPEGAKTAPQLPNKLRKEAGISDESAKPISIAKLDELTERIAGPKNSEEPKKAEPKLEQSDDEEEPPAPKDEDLTKQSTNLDDIRVDEAVDDIVAYEGDVMLAVADSTAAERNRKAEIATGQKEKKGAFSAFMWFLVFAVAVIALVLLALLVTGGNFNDIKL